MFGPKPSLLLPLISLFLINDCSTLRGGLEAVVQKSNYGCECHLWAMEQWKDQRIKGEDFHTVTQSGNHKGCLVKSIASHALAKCTIHFVFNMNDVRFSPRIFAYRSPPMLVWIINCVAQWKTKGTRTELETVMFVAGAKLGNQFLTCWCCIILALGPLFRSRFHLPGINSLQFHDNSRPEWSRKSQNMTHRGLHDVRYHGNCIWSEMLSHLRGPAKEIYLLSSGNFSDDNRLG